MAHDDQVEAIIKGIEKLTEKVVLKITLDVTANLIGTTPVDTGWARANWVPALGTPFIANLDGVDPLQDGVVSAANGRQQKALAGVLRYKLSNGSVFVSNNVPYITDLNLGSSRKAPAGFVQIAIEKAVTQDIKGI